MVNLMRNIIIPIEYLCSVHALQMNTGWLYEVIKFDIKLQFWLFSMSTFREIENTYHLR